MKTRQFIREYLAFSRKERIGITVILVLLFSVFFFPMLRGFYFKKRVENADSSWISAIRKLEQHPAGRESLPSPDIQQPERSRPQNPVKGATYSLFYFDPNTLSREKWLQLGIRERTIATIENYLSRGGSFRKAEDLLKVYGFRKEDFERIAPYIRIGTLPGTTATSHAIARETQTERRVRTKMIGPVDINSADTAAFISLPGIGSKLALRIVSFRERLGGFYSIEQLKETYGITDSAFRLFAPFLSCNSAAIRKININTATRDELKKHPYIKWPMANAIIEYRDQHGPYKSAGELTNIALIGDADLKRLLPYLDW